MEIIWFVIIVLILLAGFWYFRQRRKYKQKRTSSSIIQSSGHVILIVLDSLMDKPLQEAIDKGNAPALKYLKENGQYFPEVVSSFPTMSMTIDTSLLTGTYAEQHKIPALVWYDEQNNQLISYGSAWKEISMLGVKNVLNNAVYSLNNKHISPNVQTIHEELAQNGQQSSSVNALIYRGSETKQLRPPRLASYLNLLPEEIHTKGTTYFSYGSLSKVNPQNRYSHFWQAFGFNDKFSADEIIHMIQQNTLPKFTIAYMPNNDKAVHKKGPKTTAGIEKTDRELQKILNTYGSWNEALKSNIWLVMGDSGQAPIANHNNAFIDLPSLLKDYRIPKLSESVKSDDQIVLGLNERMAYVYLLDKNLDSSEIAGTLKKDSRIGFAAWREKEEIKVTSGENQKVFSFRSGGIYTDNYGQTIGR